MAAFFCFRGSRSLAVAAGALRMHGSRVLRIVDGAAHLGFRCTSCGACCKTLRVAITHHDLARLSVQVREAPGALVEWLPPDAVDMTGEPGTFVELRQGRRLMVLAHREGACRFFGADARCQVYAARPRDCELFPFHLERAGDDQAATLSLLDLEGCDYARDGSTEPETLAAANARRWRELEEYQASVARWNRLSKHRGRLGRAIGGADEFLTFVLAATAKP